MNIHFCICRLTVHVLVWNFKVGDQDAKSSRGDVHAVATKALKTPGRYVWWNCWGFGQIPDIRGPQTVLG